MSKIVILAITTLLLAGCASGAYDYTVVEHVGLPHGKIRDVTTSKHHETAMVTFESNFMVKVDVTRHLLSNRELVRGRVMSTKLIVTRSGKEYRSLCADLGKRTEWCVPIISYHQR
jgi:hypothetical protein